MINFISKVLLGIATCIALLVFFAIGCALAGVELAVWALGGLLNAGLPLLIFWLLCLAIGLELRLMSRRSLALAGRRKGAVIFGTVLIAAGLAAFGASYLGLRTFSAHTIYTFMIGSMALVWLGSYILRRRPG